MINKNILKQIILEQNEYFSHKNKQEIERDKLKEIEKFIKLNHVIIISGIRRCGKSVFLKQIKEKYYPKSTCYYFNFEDERLINFQIEDFNLLYELFIEIFGEEKTFFFDEIQNITGWERFVRRMQDQGSKFFITGSNASLLSQELGTKLTGRHINIELFPFSFHEFLKWEGRRFKTNDLLITKERAQLNKLWQIYFKQGGFPEFLKNPEHEILEEVYRDILYKDIAVRYGITDIKTLKELFLYLVTNFSNLFSYNKLKNIFSLGSVNTIKSYINYFENSFLIFTLNAFDYSLKKQIINAKKNYIIDNGLARALRFSFIENEGAFLENLIFLELKRKNEEIYYYKTKNNYEIDFITKDKNKIKDIIQVSYVFKNQDTIKREERALIDAMEELNLNQSYLINEEENKEKKIGKKKIIYIKTLDWMLRAP